MKRVEHTIRMIVPLREDIDLLILEMEKDGWEVAGCCPHSMRKMGNNLESDLATHQVVIIFKRPVTKCTRWGMDEAGSLVPVGG